MSESLADKVAALLDKPGFTDDPPIETEYMSAWEAQEVRSAWRSGMSSYVDAILRLCNDYERLQAGRSVTSCGNELQSAIRAARGAERFSTLIDGNAHRLSFSPVATA